MAASARSPRLPPAIVARLNDIAAMMNVERGITNVLYENGRPFWFWRSSYSRLSAAVVAVTQQLLETLGRERLNRTRPAVAFENPVVTLRWLRSAPYIQVDPSGRVSQIWSGHERFITVEQAVLLFDQWFPPQPRE